MAAQDEHYRQAAWTYVVYGVVYWLGGLALAQSGRGPRGMERGRWAWFIIGGLFVVIFPWLLARAWRWRRAFAGLLAVLVAYRALEVARIAWRSSGETVAVAGVAVSMQAGAWAFCLLAVVTALMLARAASGRQP
jgi:hypothetical protein